MAQKTKFTRLAHKYLTVVMLFLKCVNLLMGILSKVVNYARPVPKFRILVLP